MPNFFHVTPNPLTPGQILQPGRFESSNSNQRSGSASGYRNSSWSCFGELYWKRLGWQWHLQPPHGLSCIFATREMAHAIPFRDRWRKGDQIYEVSCAEETPTHDGNYDAITDPPRGGVPLLNFMPKYAVSYWRDKPAVSLRF